MSSVIPSRNHRKIALDTEQDLALHPSVSYVGSSASGARPSHSRTGNDLNTGIGDVTGEERTGPAQDVTRASSKDHIGGDVAMEEDSVDENSGRHPSSPGPDSRRRITKKRRTT